MATQIIPHRCGQTKFHPLDYASALGFFTYASGATITPICLVILARDLSFSLAAAGSLEVARSFLVVASLLLSGVLAGRFGKVRSLGYANCLQGIGLLVYAVAPHYGIVLLAMGVMGATGGVVEALINPLIQDLHPANSGRYLNFVNAFWSVGMLVTMLGAGEWLTQGASWRYLLVGLALLSLVSGLLYLALGRHDARSTRLRTREVLGHKLEVLCNRRFLLFGTMMFVAGAAEGGLTFWSATLIQLHHGGLPRAGGIGAALFALGMIFGRIAAGLWISQRRLPDLLLGSTLLAMAVGFVIPFADAVGMVFILLFCAGLGIACLWPSIQSYAADRLNVDTTALFILLSCGGIPGFAAASWLMGIAAEQFSVATSFLLIPLALVVLAALLAWERRLSGQRKSRVQVSE